MEDVKELQTIQDIVKNILIKNEKARNSDSFLYLEVLKVLGNQKGIDVASLSVPLFLTDYQGAVFPPFESVGRARRKMQAEFPELSGNEFVKKHRKKNEQIYKTFALTGKERNG